MKEHRGKEKTKRKTPIDRTFHSVPNIPITEMHTKAIDLFMMSKDEIKNRSSAKVGEERNKKPKTAKKVFTKKLSEKEVDKILMEAPKPTVEEKKINEDYEWFVKKNIMKMLKEARVAQNIKKMEMKKKEEIAQRAKARSAPAKRREQPTVPHPAKSEERKPIIKKKNLPTINPLQRAEMLGRRANSPNFVHRNEPFSRLRTPDILHIKPKSPRPFHNSTPPQLPQITANQKKSHVQRLKTLFNSFQINQVEHPAKPSIQLRKEAGVSQPKEEPKILKKRPLRKKLVDKLTKTKDKTSVVKKEKKKPTQKSGTKAETRNLHKIETKKFSAQKIIRAK